ncbi:hypothetical protein [Roseobacter sp. S98]|uniref:hypothetical protein n=1 Tax=Roseobacter algicola (ex Choi et al. 2025) (nom. illeg.) TaxID=3092138 RepID=UPI0035C6DE6F
MVEAKHLGAFDSLNASSPPELLHWLSDWIEVVSASQTDLPFAAFISDFSNFSATLRPEDEKTLSTILASDLMLIVVNVVAAELLLEISVSRQTIVADSVRSRIQALSSIFLYIRETLENSVNLCRTGNDLSARVLARSVLEACDLAIVLAADASLCDEWIEAQDDSREFWHKNLSGRKLSKLRDQQLRIELKEVPDELRQYSGYRRTEAEVFSMAVHPAYQAGVMTIFQTLETVPFDTGGSEQHVGDWIAVRTLSSLVNGLGPMIASVLHRSVSELGLFRSASDGETGKNCELVSALVNGAAVTQLLSASGLNSQVLRDYVSNAILDN